MSSMLFLMGLGGTKLVAGFVKTDKEFQSRGVTSGTTVTYAIVDGWTVTVACVGDYRCILDTQDGAVSVLTVDHRLEENMEERERVTASGGEVGRLKICGSAELSNAGGRLIIASDGIWDALTSEMAAKSCCGLPAELASMQVVKVQHRALTISKNKVQEICLFSHRIS